MKKSFVLMGVLLASLCISKPVFAELRLPSNVERVDIAAGETTTGVIVVENVSNEEVSARAYLEDLQYVAPYNGMREVLPLGSTPYSLGKFTSIEPAEFKIPAKSTQKVTYTIKAPSDAKGGYYGAVLFEQVNSASAGGFGVIVRLGYKILAEAKDKTQDVKLVDLALNENVCSGIFANVGDVIIFSDPSYTIIDDQGMVLDRGEISKELSLPPGKEAPFKFSFAKDIPAGAYTLVFDFNLQGSGALSREIDLSISPSGATQVVKVKN